MTPDETFLDTVLETAAGIAATAPIASRLTKVALRDGGHADFDTAIAWEALAQPVTLATEDLQEGVRARRSAVAGLPRPLTPSAEPPSSSPEPADRARPGTRLGGRSSRETRQLGGGGDGAGGTEAPGLPVRHLPSPCE